MLIGRAPQLQVIVSQGRIRDAASRRCRVHAKVQGALVDTGAGRGFPRTRSGLMMLVRNESMLAESRYELSRISTMALQRHQSWNRSDDSQYFSPQATFGGVLEQRDKCCRVIVCYMQSVHQRAYLAHPKVEVSVWMWDE